MRSSRGGHSPSAETMLAVRYSIGSPRLVAWSSVAQSLSSLSFVFASCNWSISVKRTDLLPDTTAGMSNHSPTTISCTLLPRHLYRVSLRLNGTIWTLSDLTFGLSVLWIYTSHYSTRL
jgi:hypothetical protein